jgi:predicted glycogen debranching enzyme
MLDFLNADFETLARKEWIYTNGLGGYASGTISGANTRRYHGLLVASLNPPTQRTVLVSKVEETLFDGENAIELGCNRFGETIAPQGHRFIQKFERYPFPKTIYDVHGFRYAKSVFMPYGKNATVVRYENLGNKTVRLKVNILLNHRDYHSNLHENGHTNFFTEAENGVLKTFAHFGAEPIFTYHEGEFETSPNWYKNYFYEREAERGLQATEDNFSIGFIHITLAAGVAKNILFSQEAFAKKPNFDKLKDTEIKRLEALRTSDNAFLNDLLVSGDQFLVERRSTESHSIIAGYHWFTDWGRDSMITMRGLAIDSGNKKVCQSILNTFFNYLDQGMLPNRFPDAPYDAIEYNTIDATLWLFVVMYEYYEKFGDKEFIKKSFDKLTEIIQFHKSGTRYDIHETPEGFLYGGQGIAQLTWMDARVGDYVVTPRHGCPVEIQALWYNALKIYSHFAEALKKSDVIFDSVADSIQRFETNFSKEFFNENGYLNDVVLPNRSADASLRCNQIYAVSLPFSPLDKTQQQQVLNTVTDKLLTPYGLRTLSQDHPDFRATFGGDVWQRDSAYHQGTVWPFLMSEYTEAYLKVHGKNAKTKDYIHQLIQPLKHHFYQENCIMGVSEIFDGDTPKLGKGTIQQAWSVSALIRILQQIR